MKITELTHSQSIETMQGNGLKHWFRYQGKAELDLADSIARGFMALEQEVEAAYTKRLQGINYVVTNEDYEVNKQPQPKQSIEDGYLFLIKNATSIKELKMYEKLANNPKYSNLKEPYNTRLKELID